MAETLGGLGAGTWQQIANNPASEESLGTVDALNRIKSAKDGDPPIPFKNELARLQFKDRLQTIAKRFRQGDNIETTGWSISKSHDGDVVFEGLAVVGKNGSIRLLDNKGEHTGGFNQLPIELVPSEMSPDKVLNRIAQARDPENPKPFASSSEREAFLAQVKKIASDMRMKNTDGWSNYGFAKEMLQMEQSGSEEKQVSSLGSHKVMLQYDGDLDLGNVLRIGTDGSVYLLGPDGKPLDKYAFDKLPTGIQSAKSVGDLKVVSLSTQVTSSAEPKPSVHTSNQIRENALREISSRQSPTAEPRRAGRLAGSPGVSPVPRGIALTPEEEPALPAPAAKPEEEPNLPPAERKIAAREAAQREKISLKFMQSLLENGTEQKADRQAEIDAAIKRKVDPLVERLDAAEKQNLAQAAQIAALQKQLEERQAVPAGNVNPGTQPSAGSNGASTDAQVKPDEPITGWNTGAGPGGRSVARAESLDAKEAREIQEYDRKTEAFEVDWANRINNLLNQIEDRRAPSQWLLSVETNITSLISRGSWMREEHKRNSLTRLMKTLPDGLGEQILKDVQKKFPDKKADEFCLAVRDYIHRYRREIGANYNRANRNRIRDRNNRGAYIANHCSAQRADNNRFLNIFKNGGGGIGGLVDVSRDIRGKYIELLRRNVQQPGAERLNWLGAARRTEGDINRLFGR